jgi:tetratricopeptide (TPR) repeat protein
LNNLALSYDRIDRLDESLQALEKVLNIDPSNELAMARRARILRMMGRIEDSLKMRETLCSLYPLKAEHWSERIFLMGSLDRDTQIPDLLLEAENFLDPTAVNYWQLAKGLEAATLIPDAEKYMLKAASVDSAFHVQVAEFYWRTGSTMLAFQQASIARNIDPNNLVAVKILMQIMKTLGLLGLSVADLDTRHELLVPEVLFSQLVKRAPLTI